MPLAKFINVIIIVHGIFLAKLHILKSFEMFNMANKEGDSENQKELFLGQKL